MRDKHPIVKRLAKIRTDIAGFIFSVIAVGIVIFFIAHILTSPSLPTPVGQNCGTITYSYQTVSGAPADCLWNAYLKCQTATFTYTVRGIDTGVTHVIIVQRGDHGCTVTDSVDSWSDNGPGRHDVSSYTCAGMLAPTAMDFDLTDCGAEGNVQFVFIGPTPIPVITPTVS